MQNDMKQRQYMALAPLASLAGIFIDPLASTIAPLLLYFIFRNKQPKVGITALRAADLAFSIQLWIVLISLVLMLGISINVVSTSQTQPMMGLATTLILVIFVVSLLYATYQAFNGKMCNYIISFKIAERVLGLVDKKKPIDGKTQK